MCLAKHQVFGLMRSVRNWILLWLMLLIYLNVCRTISIILHVTKHHTAVPAELPLRSERRRKALHFEIALPNVSSAASSVSKSPRPFRPSSPVFRSPSGLRQVWICLHFSYFIPVGFFHCIICDIIIWNFRRCGRITWCTHTFTYSCHTLSGLEKREREREGKEEKMFYGLL